MVMLQKLSQDEKVPSTDVYGIVNLLKIATSHLFLEDI
jgi:hypothetical protein